MRWLRVPLVIAGIIAAGYGWIATDERFGRPERPLMFEKFRLTPPPRFNDALSAVFTICDGPVRANCVVVGDTFWFRGDKIRIADINAPEISQPHCPAEKDVGELARVRLLEMLNERAFSLTSGWRDEDRYGRKLRTVWRSGESPGEQLVSEGLARRWEGSDIGWCEGS